MKLHRILSFILPGLFAAGTVSIVPNASTYVWGVSAAEAGINIESIDLDYKPEFKNFLMSRQNEKIAFAVASPEVEVSIQGEISGSTGLMAATFIAVTVLGNSIDYFGVAIANAWSIFLDGATVSMKRDGWKSVNWKGSGNKGITA